VLQPELQLLNPDQGICLAAWPLYDPRTYAIRRLVDNRIDPLDTIEELELDLRQRWQTKRGFPGQQHIVDWMTLDLSATYFPHPSDNFGQSFGFLAYSWVWNIGDQTQLYSSGLADPAVNEGTRTFSIGASFLRSDRTTLSLEYR